MTNTANTTTANTTATRVAPAAPQQPTVAKAKAKANSRVKQTAAAAKPAVDPIVQARANVKAKAKSGVGVTLHTSGAPIKGLAAEQIIAKPQRKMLRAIASIKGHPGTGNCVKRFHLYKVGMTLLHCKITEGLIVSDVTYYEKLGYLKLREPTDQEYNNALKAWQEGKFKAA